ncbi:MAG: Ig-like domain-containing protein [Bacteroidales bacterium]|nr:Ig-like domain-containing protein [Bacteroidales bacterium]
MKKSFFILLSIGFLLFSCTPTEQDIPDSAYQEEEETDAKVFVRFNVSVADLKAFGGNPETKGTVTKALTNTPKDDLTDLHIAVFGRSGYLKEYVLATMVDEPEENGALGSDENRYGFYATLSLSENSERHIHIIGNGPDELEYAKETELLDTLRSPRNRGAYWQSFIVPGIKGKRDANGNLIGMDTTVIDGETVYLGSGTFELSDETAAYFEDVPLIRNYAKIVIEVEKDEFGNNISHFTPISFAAYNFPTRGSVAPYYTGGFISGYETKSYEDLFDMGYRSNLPPHTEFTAVMPPKSAFLSPAGRTDVATAEGSFFLYERPAPDETTSPTVVIIYGHFSDPDTDDGSDDSGNFFYKVDLMEGSSYYPIYRNFKYRINIKEILKPGADSPDDALHSMGSGDVSIDPSTQTLLDISDGTSRILVSEMNRTIIHQYPLVEDELTTNLTLKYHYIPNVKEDSNSDGKPDWDNDLVADGGPVTISLQSVSEAVITGYSVAEEDDGEGWREITLTTSAPTDNMRTQYIRISGTYGDNLPLYRNVTYTMISRQDMTVTCVPSKVQELKGEELEVDISIPKNLPSSMFPIIFYLESDKLSITPDNTKENNNLPVGYGPSIISGNGSATTFHYIRTLSETEYDTLSAASSTNTVTVRCYFKTNTASSASTIYVTDKENFFKPDDDDFTNYVMKDFTSLSFPIGISTTVGDPTPFSFTMDSTEPFPPRVYLNLAGLRPRSGSGLSEVTDHSDPYYGWYWYSPTETDVVALRNNYTPTINLGSTSTTGLARVILNADEYNPNTLSVGYVSGVSLNKDRTILNLGTYEDLVATVTPADAANKSVTWRSSNPDVATVDNNGRVTAVARGITEITVHTVDGGYEASCTVIVRMKVWHSQSYTLTFDSSNYTTTSFTTNPQNIVFTDTEYGSYYKLMGRRTGFLIYTYYSGKYTVTAPTGYDECRIIGLAHTYSGSYNTRTVTYRANNSVLSGTNAAWGTTNTSSVSEVAGYDSVEVTMNCTSSTDHSNRNRLQSITVYYGYFTYD